MRLKWRKPSGKFSRPPSLEALGDVMICVDKKCGKIIVKTNGTFPPECPRCGKARREGEAMNNEQELPEPLPAPTG